MSVLLKSGMTAPMSTHTPGPWHGNAERIFGNGHNIASVNDAGQDWAANRDLIAAAPDLLKLVKDIANLDHYCLAHGNKTLIDDLRAWKMEARAAIAKAEGTS